MANCVILTSSALEHIVRAKQLIADAELELACKELIAIANSLGFPDIEDKIVFIQSRIADLSSDVGNGTIDFSETNIERNKIRVSLFTVVQECQSLIDGTDDGQKQGGRISLGGWLPFSKSRPRRIWLTASVVVFVGIVSYFILKNPTIETSAIDLSVFLVDREVASHDVETNKAFEAKWDTIPYARISFMAKVASKNDKHGQLNVVPLKEMDQLVEGVKVSMKEELKMDLSRENENSFRDAAYAVCRLRDPKGIHKISPLKPVRVTGELIKIDWKVNLLLRDCVVVNEE